VKNILLSMITVLALVAAPLTVSAQGQNQNPGTIAGIEIPIVGSGGGGTFTGEFLLQRFAVADGAVAAVGRISGTFTDAAGNTTSIVRTIAAPITNTQASCDILHLELGPLDLDVLGLVVSLNRVVLDIDAQSGPGNLLGNLLCAVTGLLDNPSGLANLLNRILAILG
jgi:hypothetical protein